MLNRPDAGSLCPRFFGLSTTSPSSNSTWSSSPNAPESIMRWYCATEMRVSGNSGSSAASTLAMLILVGVPFVILLV
jgi:hypothetical protein